MTKLVGILNLTPDSFSDGGLYVRPQDAIDHAAEMFEQGAIWVDVGAESTRPGAMPISDQEEWQRLEPVLPTLLSRYPGRISLDSYHTATHSKAFEIGEVIMNDVTGFNDPEMVALAAAHKPTVIISQLPNMGIQQAHKLKPVKTVEEVKEDLLERGHLLMSKGLDKEQIILDPGLGFGKVVELNSELVKFGDEVPGWQVMIGHSRKSFLGENRMNLERNLTAARIAIAHGAAYLRVHDVAGHAQLLQES